MHHSITKALYEMFPREEKGDFFHAYLYLKHLNHFMYHALKASGSKPKEPESDLERRRRRSARGDGAGRRRDRGEPRHQHLSRQGGAAEGRPAAPEPEAGHLLEPPETVIPYQQARSVILQNPESISVGECACRAAAEESCLGEGERDVCLFVGDPHAAFVREFNPKFRKISQDDAMALLEDAHAKGFVHCAYFKKDIGRRFVAICNCCSCCCQGMKAWNLFGRCDPAACAVGLPLRDRRGLQRMRRLRRRLPLRRHQHGRGYGELLPSTRTSAWAAASAKPSACPGPSACAGSPPRAIRSTSRSCWRRRPPPDQSYSR